MDRNIIYILGILESIEKIFIYANGFLNAESLLESNDQKEFNAIYNLLLFISETVKNKINPKLLNQFKTIPWNEIKGFRNRLAHEYSDIDPEILFDIVTVNLPQLKNAFIAMLKTLEIEKTSFLLALNSKYYSHLSYLETELF